MANNILLITIDSLRFDHIVPHNHYKNTELFSDFLTQGVSFNKAFATGPGTTCSFPALLTGTLPLSYGGLGPLSPNRPRVASKVQESGLTTAAFHSNPFLSTHFNYDVGFGTFKDYQNPFMGVATKLFPRGIEVNNPIIKRFDETLNLTGVLKTVYQMFSGKSRPYVAADVITDDVINWLEQTEDQFFCWAHYMDAHHPCFPPEEIRSQFDLEHVTASEVSNWYSTALESPEELTDEERNQFKKLYEAAITYTDAQIGRIAEHLKSTGRWEDTLVVLTSDHGELFGEYGSYGKPIRMYDELIHVPLIIANGPRYLADHNEALISLLDIPPIFHDALGEESPPTYEGRLPGVSTDRDYVVAEHRVGDGIVVGARSSRQLYEHNEIRDQDGFFCVGPDTFDVIPDEQGEKELRSIVQERLGAVDAGVDIGNLETAVEDRLEELGYL